MKSKRIELMKFGSAAEAFQINDFQIDAPKFGEVQVEVLASGLNFADIMARRGMYAPVKKLPFTLGYDVVAKVVAVGEGVDASWLDKKVLSLSRFRGYSKHLNLSVHGLVEIPDSIEAGEAISYTTAFLTAYLMVEDYAGMVEGKSALVYSAAGGVGYFLYHFLLQRGAIPTAIVGTEDKRSLIKEHGVKREIHLTQEFASEDKKFDLIFNARGGQTVKADLKRLNPGGRIVLFGAADQLKGGGIIGKLKLLFGFGFHSPIKLIVNSTSICGFNLLSFSAARPEAVVKAHKRAVAEFINSNTKVLPSCGFAPEKIGEAHSLMESGLSTGKLYIDWTA